MAETDISILVRVKDEASAAMGKISGSINNLQPAFKTMTVAGTAALGAIGAVAYKSIKDYAEAEKAQKQLEHATLQVAKGTREQLEAMKALSNELERKGVLDGDAIATGLAQLQTFGLSTDMVTKLGSSMADLAVNQFGVNAGAEELTQTANIMAKALNGQFGVLEKSGIRFTEAQRKLIQFGTESERVAALQEGLAQNLKYTNEVASQTVEGSMAKLQVQLGNISENIGAALLPALTQLVTYITPIIEKVVNWSSENPKLISTILAVGAGVAALVTALGAIGLIIPAVISGVTALGTALMFLAANPIGIVIVAVAALVAGIVLVIKHWDWVKEKTLEVWNSLPNFVQTAIQILLIPLTGLIGVIVLIVTHWETLKNATIAVWNAITAAVISKFNEIKAGIQAGYEIILAIANAFSAAYNAASDAMWNGIKNKVAGVWDSIKSIVTGSINFLIDKINSFINKVNSVASKAAGIVKINAPQIPNIPYLAQGGIVTKPTIAMIGEAGAEAVIPLSKADKYGFGGGSGLTVVLQGTFMTSREQADYFGDILAGVIKQQIRI